MFGGIYEPYRAAAGAFTDDNGKRAYDWGIGDRFLQYQKGQKQNNLVMTNKDSMNPAFFPVKRDSLLAPDGTQTDFAKCAHVGWAGVAASRGYYGTYGFLYYKNMLKKNDAGIYVCEQDPDTSKFIQHKSPPTTKYLKLSVDIRVKGTARTYFRSWGCQTYGDPSVSTWDYKFSGDQSIDKFSGILSNNITDSGSGSSSSQKGYSWDVRGTTAAGDNNNWCGTDCWQGFYGIEGDMRNYWTSNILDSTTDYTYENGKKTKLVKIYTFNSDDLGTLTGKAPPINTTVLTTETPVVTNEYSPAKDLFGIDLATDNPATEIRNRIAVFTYNTNDPNGAPDGSPFPDMTDNDSYEGTGISYGWEYGGQVGLIKNETKITFSRTDTAISYVTKFTQTVTDGSFTATLSETEQSIKYNLSDPWTNADFLSDLEDTLLGKWDLLDRKLLPLQTATFDGHLPKVMRFEKMAVGVGSWTNILYYYPTKVNVSTITGGIDMQDNVDPMTGKLTGEIVGEPLGNPSDDYWSWLNPRIVGSSAMFGQFRSTYPTLPKTATCWTNVQTSVGIPTWYIDPITVGRNRLEKFIAIDESVTNVISSGYGPAHIVQNFIVTKWVESSVLFPSFDHARPCGTDADWLNLDTGWNCSSGTSSGPRYARLPPMSGRLAVTGITDNGNGTVTFTHEPMGKTNAAPFAVNICDDAMAPLLKNKAPIFSTIRTSVITCEYRSVKNAKWICLFGSMDGDKTNSLIAPWYWGDTSIKGDWVWAEWNKNGEYYDQINYSAQVKLWNQFMPWLLVLSPSDLDAPLDGQGVRFDFSTEFIINPCHPLIYTANLADSKGGCNQWLVSLQAMLDPLWQGFTKTGTCAHKPSAAQIETKKYYEARISPPPDAPSGGNFINYKMETDATKLPPPTATTTLACYLAPTGVYTPSSTTLGP